MSDSMKILDYGSMDARKERKQKHSPLPNVLK